MALNKNTLPRASYQQWSSANMSQGDILDVYSSLGNRPAKSVTIQTGVASGVVRFNVIQPLFREAGTMYEDWVGLGQGNNRPLPLPVTEVKNTAQPPLLLLGSGIVTFTEDQISIKDIEVVSMNTGLIITVF